MFVLLFLSKLLRFLGEGPLWHPEFLEYQCRKYWWTNLLYINNFYPTSFDAQVRLFTYLNFKENDKAFKFKRHVSTKKTSGKSANYATNNRMYIVKRDNVRIIRIVLDLHYVINSLNMNSLFYLKLETRT